VAGAEALASGVEALASGVVVPRNPSVPASEPMAACPPPPVAPIAARATVAKAGAQSVAAATIIAFRRTLDVPPERGGMKDPCGEAV
jgi:hypothetical protein